MLKDKCECVNVKAAQSCPTLCNPMDCPGNSLGQNTGVGSLSLLQGIFPAQESNPGLQTRDQTQVFHTAGRCFTSWATREAHGIKTNSKRHWIAHFGWTRWYMNYISRVTKSNNHMPFSLNHVFITFLEENWAC